MSNYSKDQRLRSQSNAILAKKIIVYVVVGFLSFMSIFPFYFMFMNSTWSSFEITSGLRLWIGSFSTLAMNVKALMGRNDFDFVIGFKNSFIISTSATFLSVYFSAMTAYAIKVYRFKLRNFAFTFILVVLMVPTSISITGFVKMIMNMNLYGTFWPLILPALASPVAVFFIKQYLDSALSLEIIEASRIDGANELYTFNRICLPIMVPALATQAIFGYVATWNNYFTPSIILTDIKHKTLPLMVAQLWSDRFVDYGQIYTGLSVSVIPLIIVYAFLQRFIIQGVASGSVKE